MLQKTNKFALLPDDGFIDPYLLATFYAKAAKKHGAVLKTNIEVTALQKIWEPDNWSSNPTR
jgi:hypothetical protein